jgi:endo-1,4-beta-xylanase
MKWDALERTRGVLNYQGAMSAFNFAMRHNYTMRGHTLVWHKQIPEFIKRISDKATLTAAMQSHIKQALGPGSPFHGKCAYWDVINEM